MTSLLNDHLLQREQRGEGLCVRELRFCALVRETVGTKTIGRREEEQESERDGEKGTKIRLAGVRVAVVRPPAVLTAAGTSRA